MMFVLNLNNSDERASFEIWGHQPSQEVDYRLVVGKHEERHSLYIPCDVKYLSVLTMKPKEQGDGLDFVVAVHPLKSKLLIGRGASAREALSNALNNEAAV